MQTDYDTLPRTAAARPLAGRIAVVTGAASGLGAATARSLAEAGARVALIARRADRLDALAGELGSGRALAVPADVTDPAALDAASARVTDTLGPADLVVANAGVMLPGPLASCAQRNGDAWSTSTSPACWRPCGRSCPGCSRRASAETSRT
jgi:NADP-dependent 3-hydroxy acid dehydrogenase YdfG